MYQTILVFELFVYIHIYDDLKGQLADCQHGLLVRASRLSQIYSNTVDSIYKDFSKAFDKMRHRKCRLMLSHPAISG
jgi:hypothetical protein